jgi:hypothetical protein
MEYKIDDFYDGEIGNYKLKKEYLLSYAFSPGLYDKLCRIEFFVKKNLTYKLFLFFHDQNGLSSEFKNPSDTRILFYQESKLPFSIRQVLIEINKIEFHLNESYYNSKNTFGILDRTHTHANINLENKYYSIDLCPDTLDKNQFKTKSELQFLKLLEQIEKFLEQARDFNMESYK